MYSIKGDELVYSGDTIKEKIEIVIRDIWNCTKQIFPCLYYGVYTEDDGLIWFYIYRKWFGYVFAIQSFPVDCECAEGFFDEENVEDDDGMEE